MESSYLILFMIMAVAVGFSTVIGAGVGILLRSLPHRFNDIILGAASGIMLAAAVLGLIIPALEQGGAWSVPLCFIGVFAGAFLISVLDKITPHLHHIAGTDKLEEVHKNNHSLDKTLLFISAIALHKIPEGLAAGISFGTGELNDILSVTGSISLQNIPEAMVIIVPLLTVGITVKRTLLIAVSIGAISILSMLVGFGFVFLVHGLLSLFLGLAGGAMLYVVSDEMIPETHSHGYEKPATFSLIAGFMLIMLLQQLLP